jgi:hypothetical protein
MMLDWVSGRSTRAIAVAAGALCGLGAASSYPPAPAPARSNLPGVDQLDRVRGQVCVVVGDSIRMITVTRSPTTGDTLADGVPFMDAHPASNPPYADEAWYRAHEPVRFAGHPYARNHPPQEIPGRLLRLAGKYEGISIFKAMDERANPPSYIYLPLRPGCVFQPLSIVTSG